VVSFSNSFNSSSSSSSPSFLTTSSLLSWLVVFNLVSAGVSRMESEKEAYITLREEREREGGRGRERREEREEEGGRGGGREKDIKYLSTLAR